MHNSTTRSIAIGMFRPGSAKTNPTNTDAPKVDVRLTVRYGIEEGTGQDA